eukprot:m.121254 g.121254  ORF g.121254 m.121254 type:complete len:180 (-) comp15518_c0_seq21:655-1194(-)
MSFLIVAVLSFPCPCQGIIKKDHAYVTPSGVYFDIDAFGRSKYGRLGKGIQSSGEMSDPEANDALGLGDKRHAADFALWKKGREGDPTWPAPFGSGRPGWHIECSAMASKHLGSEIDIHSGGIDLLYPHHTNELAQCENVKIAWQHHLHQRLSGSAQPKSPPNAMFAISLSLHNRFQSR